MPNERDKVPEIIENLDIIQQLGDNPGADDGLEPNQLKAKFDEAGNIIKQYINTHIVPFLNDFVSPTGDGFIKKAGDTMAGILNMGSHKITDLAQPENPQDAATKKFVDDENTTFFERGKVYCNDRSWAYTNVKVERTAFTQDSGDPDFPWKANVPLSKAQANMFAVVAFSSKDSISGVFSQACETYEGGVTIYASEQPEGQTTIPTIALWRVST